MHIDKEFIPDEPARLPARAASLTAGMEPLQAFADRAEALARYLETLEGLTGKSAARAVTRLRRELEAFEPAVTFLGQVKSGKTTLVNAMAGWADLLPSDVNPWTSVVTSLHITPGSEKSEISARFQFMEADEWDRLVQKGGRLGEMANRAGSDGELEKIRAQIEALREKSRKRLGRKFELLLGQEHEYGYFDKNLLERYICIGDDFYDGHPADQTGAQGRFADITRAAHLYLSSDSRPLAMCLRDTPGVNDTFMMREQVTINAIRDSRICVVVLSAQQALTSVDMALIRMISSLQSRDVVIFVNRIDELSDPASEVPQIEAGIRRVLAEQKGPENAQIVFGSAVWAHHVLTASPEEMTGQTAQSLRNWAAAEGADADETPDAETVWRLSGLEALNRIVAERVVETLGDPLLEKLTTSAVTIASGQQAANKVMVAGDSAPVSMSMHEIKAELASLRARHEQALASRIAEIAGGYRERADRAHANFIERATEALIAHLERHGDGAAWNHNPTGLRMLLKSAYSVFASRAQATAKDQYEAAVVDIAELYYKAFGKAVEGIELRVPEVEEFPPPVAIAQTIALDFNDGWWASWWRRTRGYKAFAKQFRALVLAETEDFMHQLKEVQTERIRAQLAGTLDSFFAQNRDIMIEISTSQGRGENLERLCLGDAEFARAGQIDGLLTALRHLMTPTQWEGQHA